jgi:hypothetical protein
MVSLVVSVGLTGFASYLDRLPVGALILSGPNFAVSWLLFALLFGAIYKVLPDRTWTSLPHAASMILPDVYRVMAFSASMSRNTPPKDHPNNRATCCSPISR